MTGIVLDAVLMLLLVAALGYGVRLEKKLTALRAGQMAFAGAVTELNSAAGRAESALAQLRSSGEEADMLHDRILKARAVKQELEILIARAPSRVGAAPVTEDHPRAIAPSAPAPAPVAPPEPDDRSVRMAALAQRIHGMAAPRAATATGREAVASILSTPTFSAMAANQAAQQSLNRARRSLDEDLFAA